VRAALAAELATDSAESWEARLARAGVPATALVAPELAAAALEARTAQTLTVTVRVPRPLPPPPVAGAAGYGSASAPAPPPPPACAGGADQALRLVRSPLGLGGAAAACAPLLGQHNAELLDLPCPALAPSP
jgi:crotonobetainyl-CoA:carnitine CoA-transferase CaiB-like acyl-CoA transferase